MTQHLRPVADIATGQHGAVTAAQIAAAGMSSSELRRRVQSGALEPIGSHTFRSPFTPRTALADLAALVLDCGEHAVASGPTAAALHGFDGFTLRPSFHVTVRRGRNVQRAHHLIHTTTELALIDRATVGGIRCTSATRTLVDLARFVDARALTAALGSALRDRRTAEHALHRRIVELRTKGRFGIPTLLAVIERSEVTRGGHSWLERRYLEVTAAAALPTPETQCVLSRAQDRLVRVDIRYPQTPVVVELLGYRWHRSCEQMARDAARLNALVLDGFVPMQFTYDQVVTDTAWMLEQVRAALALAA